MNSNSKSRKYEIYWWAKLSGRRKKFGHDIIKYAGELTANDAEDILERVVEASYGDYPGLKNFEAYYPLADFPENFGVVKIKAIQP